MLYDTHCHPYLQTKKSQEEILERFFCKQQRYLNSVGVDIDTSLKSTELAKKHLGVYAVIGIHPTSSIDVSDELDITLQQLEQLYRENPDVVVAIGECGLDYYWLESLSHKHGLSVKYIKEIQEVFFRSQIRLAKKLNIPFVIHNREAGEDVLRILREEGYTNFIFHCYSENLSYAQELLGFAPNCKLGFGGVITFKNALEIQDTAANIPLKNIILETDAPYLTPVPFRGKQENEPLYTQYVLEKIIELRNESPEEVRNTLLQNSINTFIKK